jgi:hypothetical protein
MTCSPTVSDSGSCCDSAYHMQYVVFALGFVTAGCRRPFEDILLYVCPLCYKRIYIAASWIVHRGIKQVVSDQFTVFFCFSQETDYTTLLSTEEGLRVVTTWFLQRDILTQFSLARTMNDAKPRRRG